MALRRGTSAAFICLVCFLHIGVIVTPMALAANRNLLVKQSSMSPRNIGSVSPPKNIGSVSPPKAPDMSKTNIMETTWCLVKPSTSQEKLDEIINFCCIQPGIDCSVIQPGGACYLPPNKVSDASVVMNLFYRFNGKQPIDCYFNRSGLIVDADPSVGDCIYPA